MSSDEICICNNCSTTNCDYLSFYLMRKATSIYRWLKTQYTGMFGIPVLPQIGHTVRLHAGNYSELVTFYEIVITIW